MLALVTTLLRRFEGEYESIIILTSFWLKPPSSDGKDFSPCLV
jgi:hypothetical protein